jgi:hypothetical protein
MLIKGFLHRDISIDNTLGLDPPVMMKPFEAQPIEERMAQLSLQDKKGLDIYIKRLEGVIRKMSFSGECRGFVLDGDMAATLAGYFTPRDTGEISVSTFSRAGRYD